MSISWPSWEPSLPLWYLSPSHSVPHVITQAWLPVDSNPKWIQNCFPRSHFSSLQMTQSRRSPLEDGTEMGKEHLLCSVGRQLEPVGSRGEGFPPFLELSLLPSHETGDTVLPSCPSSPSSSSLSSYNIQSLPSLKVKFKLSPQDFAHLLLLLRAVDVSPILSCSGSHSFSLIVNKDYEIDCTQVTSLQPPRC